MAERPVGPAGGRDDLLAVLAALAIAVATVLVGALAAGGGREEVAPPAATAPPAAGAPPVAAVAPDKDPACIEWTDGCVVCQRTPQRPACSTPGIACTRGPLTCLRR
jgi:hypothetical protein